MNKAFVKESSEENDDDLDVAQPAIPQVRRTTLRPLATAACAMNCCI
jgi:transcription elongation factor GreB